MKNRAMRRVGPILLGLVLLGVGFLAGVRMTWGDAESVSAPRVRLTKDLMILTSSGEAAGTVPQGTVLYVVPDPFADKTSLLKLYLEVIATDEAGLSPLPAGPDESGQPLYRQTYSLRSEEWLERGSS